MFGEIVLCQFPFTSGTASKVRPALVLFDLQSDCVICRVTSVQRSAQMDVTIVEWQGAGLLKPSIARLDRLVTAEKSVFLRRLGQLAPADLETVRGVWNRSMRL